MSSVLPVEPAAAAPPPAAPAPAGPPRAERFRALSVLLTRNPVVLKELRGRMRGPRAFIVLTLYLLLMSGFVTLLYIVYSASVNSAVSGNSGQVVGKFVFGAVVGIELLLVCFIAPAFTAGAISGERERQTYDLLRTTLLPAQALVLGKLASALSYVLLLLVAAFPLQSLAFLLGGVGPQEVVIATLLLVATAFLFGTSGIFFSSLMRRTLGSTVVTYAFALMATLGLPLILVAVIPLGTAVISNAQRSTGASKEGRIDVRLSRWPGATSAVIVTRARSSLLSVAVSVPGGPAMM